jgi:hypothetical protein
LDPPHKVGPERPVIHRQTHPSHDAFRDIVRRHRLPTGYAQCGQACATDAPIREVFRPARDWGYRRDPVWIGSEQPQRDIHMHQIGADLIHAAFKLRDLPREPGAFVA